MGARLTQALAGATLALAGAGPVLAQGQGCEHVLTSRLVGSCGVLRYLICENGERRVEAFAGDGWSEGFMVTDANLNLKSYFLLGGENRATDSPVLATHRSFSLDELLRTGRSFGSYDVRFNYETAMPGGLTWDARLTEQQVATSGVTFQVARLVSTLDDPHPILGQGGPDLADTQVLIDPERRLMILGPRIDDPRTIDVIPPDEPGFENTTSATCEPLPE